MATTVSFPTNGEQLPIEAVSSWLTESGEPFVQESSEALALRAVPITLVWRQDAALRAHLDLNASAKVDRMVKVLYDLALLLGADVHLAEAGKVTRGQLWLRLADDQDRLRIAEALQRADAMGRLGNISRAMWGVLEAAEPGRDVRWDTTRQSVVELLEVGAEGGISLEEAAWHAEDPSMGDIIARPIKGGHCHLVLWRWLNESNPSIANP